MSTEVNKNKLYTAQEYKMFLKKVTEPKKVILKNLTAQIVSAIKLKHLGE